MQTKQKLLSTVVLMACSGFSTQTYAVLPADAILQFIPGVVTTSSSSTQFVKSGSYFGMDSSGDGKIVAKERIAISQNAGLAIGKTQTASGSHGGPADGTESPGIDNTWEYFGNTGLHLTVTPPNINSDDGAGNVILGFTGWAVTWNYIAVIPMNSRAWVQSQAAFPINNDGEAVLKCAVDCAEGDTYALDYTATVPEGDPSNFGGVRYSLHMEGTIKVPPAPTTDATGGFVPGAVATTVGSTTNGRISMEQLLNNGGIADPGFTYGDGLTDFSVSNLVGAGSTAQVVITLTTPIPATPVAQPPEPVVYRKFNNGAWVTFIADGTNLIASAPATGAYQCPPVGDTTYNHLNGLVEGDGCLQLTIADNGAYDDDPTVDTIADPGGVATPVQVFVDTRTSGSNGCSMSGNAVSSNQRADWWLVAGFMGLLGLFRLKRNTHNKQV